MRAYVNFDRADYNAALADAEQALALHPNDAAALYARGLTYMRLSDYARALADLDAVLAREPFEYQSPFLTLASLREISLDRALVLQAMPGREADALAAFDAAAAAQPDWFAVYFYRGVYLAERGLTAAARADLELAAALAPDAGWQARAEEQLAHLDN
jgi:tetratricopeptide (TPR) repeat protein